jgi:hypothetical protein
MVPPGIATTAVVQRLVVVREPVSAERAVENVVAGTMALIQEPALVEPAAAGVVADTMAAGVVSMEV